jgi:hypothetical protein
MVQRSAKMSLETPSRIEPARLEEPQGMRERATHIEGKFTITSGLAAEVNRGSDSRCSPYARDPQTREQVIELCNSLTNSSSSSRTVPPLSRPVLRATRTSRVK